MSEKQINEILEVVKIDDPPVSDIPYTAKIDKDSGTLEGNVTLILLDHVGSKYRNEGLYYIAVRGHATPVSSRYVVLLDDEIKSEEATNHCEVLNKRVLKATEIDKRLRALDGEHLGPVIRFDFSRIEEFRSGWWPVLVQYYGTRKFEGVEIITCYMPCVRGILTGWNCE